MDAVRVAVVSGVIHALYEGTMNLDLVREGEKKIEDLIPTLKAPVVLYDCLSMKPPTVALALEMKAFDGRIANKIRRSATVVADATTAFCAKIAFALSRDHRVFYNDRDGALKWLKDGLKRDSK